ncbi:hypothetical protein N7519_008043 [Penicillium mononematosum]|uniref:uncharacterized protein n=1 Tax=Penicillium mononematosum TaxID=268346 RepID=UPI0025483B14|nr:uncharacterized protein N7519_008043 [Penicillium mononematosum]KAJ6186742.1 hypothetical protein N7519_008043 [Penicillium mononematosum]
MWYGDNQPFVSSFGDPTGYGLHVDFLNGWDIDVLQDAINTCHDGAGDIRQCESITMQPDWVTDGCIVERSINERIDGWLDALAGCDPIQGGPQDAGVVTACGAPTEIGESLHYYTDLTGSRRCEWIGCTQDNVGGQRILVGSSSGFSDMTPATCVEKCIADGYNIAGVENAHESFCGSTVAPTGCPRSLQWATA